MTVTVSITDATIDGPHGPIPVRGYVSETERTPALVWVHGGAYAFGDLDMPESDWVARQLAERGISVLAVQYRLSPSIDLTDPSVAPGVEGARFPVAADEVVAAFRWAAANTDVLGADPERLSIGGASAGANLAASALLQFRDAGGLQPRSGVLAYPSVHAVPPAVTPEFLAGMGDLPPMLRFLPEVIRVINLNYVGDESELDNPYAFPGGHDLRGLPPVFVLNSDRDPLRASGDAFAGELAAAGVDTLAVREVGSLHGHLNSPNDPAASLSIERISAWLHSGPLLGERHRADGTTN